MNQSALQVGHAPGSFKLANCTAADLYKISSYCLQCIFIFSKCYRNLFRYFWTKMKCTITQTVWYKNNIQKMKLPFVIKNGHFNIFFLYMLNHSLKTFISIPSFI